VHAAFLKRGEHCLLETTQARLTLRIILPCSSLQDNSWAVLKYIHSYQYASTSSLDSQKDRFQQPSRSAGEFCLKKLRGLEKDSPTPGR